VLQLSELVGQAKSVRSHDNIIIILSLLQLLKLLSMKGRLKS